MAHRTTLFEDTLKLLRKDTRSLMKIAKESGLEYFWLHKIRSGVTLNPGVLQVQKLHDFLTRVEKHSA